MKRQIILVTVLAVFMFSLATVYAQAPGHGMRMKADDDFPELTAEQKDQMADLRSEHQKAMIPMKADLKVKQVEFKDMMRNDASKAEMERKLDDIGRLKTEISKMRLDHRLKMRTILTEKQREYFDSHRGMGMHKGCHPGNRDQGRMKRMPHGHRGMGFDSDMDDFDSEALFEEAHFQGGGGQWYGDCPLN
jgi:Spy/CpxP family protein refolding chaperone